MLVSENISLAGGFMMEKKRIAVLFGGRSSEHDVSLTSAAAVMAHMDKEKYEPIYYPKYVPKANDILLANDK